MKKKDGMELIFEKLNNYFQDSWQVAVLDLKYGRWMVKKKEENIPYLRAENANGRHIIIQPNVDNSHAYLLVDDIDGYLIQHHFKFSNGSWKPGRLVIETSPQNYQVWIRFSRSISLPEKRYWLKKLRSDPGADPNNRWGRCPGFRNRKLKYQDKEGGYPLSRLIWVDWKHSAYLAVYKETFKSKEKERHIFSPKPLGKAGVCQSNIVFREQYNCGNESKTDFSFALALMRRGYHNEFIEQRILSERSNWENHQGAGRIKHYLDRTLKRAREIFSNKKSNINKFS